MELLCNVYFEYSRSVPENMKDYYEKLFIILRDKVVELLNPNYERWNLEYDMSHKEFNEVEYNKFIQSKHKEILNKFNALATKITKDVILDSDEDADICGYIPKYDSTMHMTIKLLNEKEWKEANG